jgi:hypothetical protein
MSPDVSVVNIKETMKNLVVESKPLRIVLELKSDLIAYTEGEERDKTLLLKGASVKKRT